MVMKYTNFLATVVLSSFLLSSCKKDVEAKTEIVSEEGQNHKKVWEVPDPKPTGCKILMNNTLSLDSVKWLSPQNQGDKELQLNVIWKTGSPLAKLTFSKLQNLDLPSEEVAFNFISVNAPRLETRTNSQNKSFRFGVDKEGEIMSILEVSTYPQIVITKDDVVCWQGHPDHLSREVIEELLK